VKYLFLPYCIPIVELMAFVLRLLELGYNTAQIVSNTKIPLEAFEELMQFLSVCQLSEFKSFSFGFDASL
jgi:hypothetical protein